MPLILHIDTALQTACVSIAQNGTVLSELTNTDQKDHGSFLQPAIKDILQKNDLQLQDLDAVAVIEGPGSYTGLRVGMAAAKGLCFALNKPLITINSLEALAATAIDEYHPDESILICPMIDARRMEVYTAIYTNALHIIKQPSALILEEDVFKETTISKKMIFIGSGVKKWEKIYKKNDAVGFYDIAIKSAPFSNLSLKKYVINRFADLAYAEPLYLKDFFMAASV
ncbi:MAG: tRNA (adenosine(37)-N6)-threonylcarbamoyltransferase complex dimerization subunit type 1 TsaB [Bacteroidota bacterium]